MKLAVTLGLGVAILTAPVMAETTAPYAGQDARSITSLTADRVAGLKRGDGLGYALPAELNGWPGPLHVLELQDELGLSDTIAADVRAIREAMLAQAISLGEALVAAEAALDAVFRAPSPSVAAINAATAEAAALEAKLRAVHLSAHLATAPLLTRHQSMLYKRARGYAAAGAHRHVHGSNELHP